MGIVTLQIFGQPVRITIDDSEAAAAIFTCYAAFRAAIDETNSGLIELSVLRSTRRKSEWAVNFGDNAERCIGVADLLYVVEKQLTIALQYRRPDLFFLHAAALGTRAGCVVIIGESAAGKSTLCWALCNAGFGYMSDELAPVDLRTMLVTPYPHALCLKREIDTMPPLPAATIRTGRTMHVPATALPCDVVGHSMSIRGIVFLERGESRDEPILERIGTAEGAVRLYANGLNQLAHEHDGLKAVKQLASAGPCYRLTRGNLGRMRAVVMKDLTAVAADS